MTARIPFALVGVIILVGSASLTASIHEPVVTEPAVDQELESASAQLQSAVREGSRSGARGAARDPVIRPANTSYGRVINDTSPFRDALRVRIYRQIRQNLAGVGTRQGDIRVTAQLPPTRSPEQLREAKRRIHVTRGGPNETGLRVRVDGITLTATRGGHQIARRTVSPTAVVKTPVLAVHDRVSAFEHRLGSGPLQPGLGRRLTGSLYPIVWARGYAQYGGAPIENVLANRHVALFANRAILTLQHDTFGHSDPVGRAVYGRAFTGAALTDALGGENPVSKHLREVHEEIGLTPGPAEALGDVDGLRSRGLPEETIRVGVNGTADRVFLSYLSDVNATVRETYTADVRLRATVSQQSERTIETDPRPARSHEETIRRRKVTVSHRPADPAPAPGDAHLLAAQSRLVRVVQVTGRVRETPHGTETTENRRIETYAVDLALVGSHQNGPAPARPIKGVHARGGTLGGPNMADVTPAARERLIASRGGVDELAREAALGRDVEASVRVTGDRPDRLRQRLYPGLADLRRRAANVSIEVFRGEVATFQVNPPAQLAKRLEQRRESLLDAPGRYDSVADRVRVALRAAYLDRLTGHFRERARDYRARRNRLDETLERAGSHSGQLRGAYETRKQTPGSEPLDGLRMRVHATPGYLTTGPIGPDTVASLPGGREAHPLAVRNWNAASLPYGNVADAVVEALFGPDTTRFRTAAQTLAAIERARPGTGGDTAQLRTEIARGIGLARSAATETLASFDLGDPDGRREVLSRGLARWPTDGSRALALSNGTAATAIHAAAVDRWGDQLSSRQKDLLALRLSRSVQRAIKSDPARVPEPPVEDSAGAFRQRVRDWATKKLADTIANGTKTGIEQLTGRSLSRLPAGLPVAPAPGLWYATVNLWQVSVRGEYARFAVSVPRGTPDEPGARFLYVRNGDPVLLDVDGDGERERLGRTTRVAFETGTTVGIAVPPGPRGVGDVDGQTVEQSSGWPTPGW